MHVEFPAPPEQVRAGTDTGAGQAMQFVESNSCTCHPAGHAATPEAPYHEWCHRNCGRQQAWPGGAGHIPDSSSCS